MSLGMLLYAYSGHSDQILDIAWSPDGMYIASGSSDQTVQVWSAAYGKTIFTYRGYSSWVGTVAWSPDGSCIASAGLHSPTRANQLDIWDPFTGTHLSTYSNFECEVGAIAWSPDGRRIAAGCWDSTVQVWNRMTETGETVYTHESNPGYIYAIDWSFDGKYLLSASDEGRVVVQETKTWKPLFISRRNPWIVFDAKWSPDHYAIASCEGASIQIRDALTEASLVTYSGHTLAVHALAWAPDGRRIASASDDKTVQIWDTASGEQQFTYQGYSSEMSALAWSPDGRYIASAAENGTVQVWQAIED